MINVCIPTIRRYDLLRGLLISLNASTVKPAVHVIDNGQNADEMSKLVGAFDGSLRVFTPREPLGVAASWNMFIKHVPEERVITNDDVLFAPDSLERLVAAKVDLAWAQGCGFSCYLLRDSCVNKIGLFDEMISPGYGYYEDEDYLQRIDGKGTKTPNIKAADVECGVVHLRSQTMAMNTDEEMNEHHRKFHVARANYIKKWGLELVFK